MKIETKCVQAGYYPKNGDSRSVPIYQTSTYVFDSGEYLAGLFDLTAPGHIYTRISNPTLELVENKIASLEGGVGAMLTSSGQAASLIAIVNICSAGDHIIAANHIYGGTVNLLAVTLKKFGIECTFTDINSEPEEIQKAFRPNTKLVFGESLANPALSVLDIEKAAKTAHSNGVPLIVDNTFPTPILCRPIEFGADIVIHSTTKYMDGHASTIGGVIIDGGTFDWDNGKFSSLTEPDASYHGIRYVKDFGKAAYITKARTQLMRDLGASQSPLQAFIINLGLESLHLRMERHSQNAYKVAKHLEKHPSVAWVNYPGLENNKYYKLAEKYMPNGASGIISFGVKGGKEAARKFMENLKYAVIEVSVADSRTCVLHPASTTHRQLNDEQLALAGVSPDLIRFSVGIEHIDDIIGDIDNAF